MTDDCLYILFERTTYTSVIYIYIYLYAILLTRILCIIVDDHFKRVPRTDPHRVLQSSGAAQLTRPHADLPRQHDAARLLLSGEGSVL